MTDRINQEAFKDILPGQGVQGQRVFSQSDFDRFAALSRDDNPIHVDPAFAARTRFERTVAHGMLLYSTMCAVLSAYLPGARQLTQTLKFPTPTFTGEKVTIALKVLESDLEKGILSLDTQVIRPNGQLGLEGETRVVLPGAPWPAETPPEPIRQPTDQSFKGLSLGQRAETWRVFSAVDLETYVELTGDPNPLYTDTRYARKHGLAGLMIPGGLLGGLFSYLLGTRLPGPGTNYLKQQLNFLASAHPGQELRAAVKIIRIRAEKKLVNLSTICATPAGQIICQGETLVLASDNQR